MKPKKFSRLFPLLAVIVLALAVSMTGCKKKTRKTTEETKSTPNIEEVKTDAPAETKTDSKTEMDADRQRIQAVYFDYDQSAVRGDQRDKVRTNGEIFKKWSDWSVSIEGHCDERGTNEYNLALGERRATAAKQALVAEGVAAGRISTVSYGEERPADPGHSENSWSRNRRAEFRAK